MIIAIDGPAASGKGTVARRLASHFGLPHLDTGLLYRGVGKAMLDQGLDLDNEEQAETAALTLDPQQLDDEALRGAQMGEAASRIAGHPKVRMALLTLQRDFALQSGGAVLDGRDIGTVICPDATAKLFVTASAQERARRRHRELQKHGDSIGFDEVLADIERRDERDSARSSAPLIKARDACLLDTTNLDIEGAFRAALDEVERAVSASASRQG
jgi:cytidylate kinase